MITCYLKSSRRPFSGHLNQALATNDVVWIDVLQGTDSELDDLRRATGIAIPTLASLSEIEHSSRMRREGQTIVLSLPLPKLSGSGTTLLPVGFVLSESLLLTVRFDAEAIFDDFADSFAKGVPADTSAPSVMAGIFEVITDALADRLEEMATSLDVMGGQALARDEEPPAGGSATPEAVPLRELLRQIGRVAQASGKLRSSLLTAGRIIPYVETEASSWFEDGTAARIATIKADIASLNEYETHLSDKVTFLLDATLGMINVEQNDIFKVLTIVSVVGIPPTLVASIYGMNFHNMPELSWAFGYPYGLAMIALSAAIPLVWFRIKRWF